MYEKSQINESSSSAYFNAVVVLYCNVFNAVVETLTVKMEMHCYVYITLISCIRNAVVCNAVHNACLLNVDCCFV